MDKFEIVADIIEEVTGILKDEIKPESKLIDDLDLSSIEIMIIFNNISQKCSVEINEKQMLEIESISDILKYL